MGRSRLAALAAAFSTLLASLAGVMGAAAAAVAAAKPPEFTLLTEPAAGLSAIYQLVSSAKRTVDMTMYELADPTAEALLAADAERGVRVRALLDESLAKSYNAPAYDFLKAHRVQVHWAPTSYEVTHQKTITVDGDVSVVMTLNLTSAYYATSRDFAVIDRAPADVAAIEDVFGHDFAGEASSPEPSGQELVWSPGSDARVVSAIGSARHLLYVENEEMSEYTVVDALEAAAERGVEVEVVMTYQPSWRLNFDRLVRAGVHVSTYAEDANLYIHAKVLDIDPGYADEQLVIGSQNFSWASLEYNRELGLDLGPKQAGIIESVAATVRSDYAGGAPWEG